MPTSDQKHFGTFNGKEDSFWPSLKCLACVSVEFVVPLFSSPVLPSGRAIVKFGW